MSTVTDALHAWECEHDPTAWDEGWSIFDAYCDYPELRVEALDDGPLEDDGDAWLIVMHGTEPHHVAARRLIATWSHVEWSRMACHVHGWYGEAS